jgi:ATP-dependent Clp protease protease subunit
MREHKKIYIIGDIDAESYTKFALSMDKRESEPEAGIIPIELASEGGDPYIALAFYDKMCSSKHHIHITVRGLAASAAVLLLAAGDIRYMAESAWVMVHEDSPEISEDIKVTEFEKAAAHSRRLEIQWNAILELRTGTPALTWSELHKAETYLDSNECLKLGLITKII